jgi:hypothetical protein
VQIRVRVGLAVLIVTAVFAVAEWFGSPPLLTFLAAVCAWMRVLVPRWGIPLSLSAIVAVWPLSTLVLMFLSPATPAPLPLLMSIGWVAAAGLAVVAERRWPLTRSTVTGTREWADAVGPASGAVIWLVAVALAHALPRGGGFSWAAYADSSLDVFALRAIADYNGVRTDSQANERPLEHALSASFVDPGRPIDAAATTFAADVQTHAMSWTLLVALACLLAGYVAATLARVGGASRKTATVASVIASVGMLAAPVSGIVFKRGQINAHLTWILMFSALLIALTRKIDVVLTLMMLVSLMTAAMLCWTPFAIVPGVLAVGLAWRHRKAVLKDRKRLLLWIAPPLYVFVWTFFVLRHVDMFIRLGSSPDAAAGAVTADAIYANPAWIPLTATLAAAAIALSCASLTHARRAALVTITAVGSLVVAAVPFVLARGGVTGELEYYTARYMSMTAVLLGPIVLGWGLACLARPAWRPRAVAVVSLTATCAVVVAAPASPLVATWGFTPVYLANGEYFGTRDQMITKVYTYGDDVMVRVAWDADPPYDFWVNYMLMVNDPDDRQKWASDLRVATRNFGVDTSIERLCGIGEATDRPVIAFTHNPALKAQLQAACPADGVEVRLIGTE